MLSNLRSRQAEAPVNGVVGTLVGYSPAKHRHRGVYSSVVAYTAPLRTSRPCCLLTLLHLFSMKDCRIRSVFSCDRMRNTTSQPYVMARKEGRNDWPRKYLLRLFGDHQLKLKRFRHANFSFISRSPPSPPPLPCSLLRPHDLLLPPRLLLHEVYNSLGLTLCQNLVVYRRHVLHQELEKMQKSGNGTILEQFECLVRALLMSTFAIKLNAPERGGRRGAEAARGRQGADATQKGARASKTKERRKKVLKASRLLGALP